MTSPPAATTTTAATSGSASCSPVLSAHGHGALAWRVLSNPTAPGWRAWLEAGNSTFAEMWERPRSHSHYFMGTPVTWLHEHVAGRAAAPRAGRSSSSPRTRTSTSAASR
ncbi:hypothetical protein [Brachybacterium sp. GPGPB12]|uniref:alpha-L-rhamnosidase-related protein n=1 Tax=Brachybacterium sp. GPGPB12 TaxID=3023517 RepID=UPI00313457EA